MSQAAACPGTALGTPRASRQRLARVPDFSVSGVGAGFVWDPVESMLECWGPLESTLDFYKSVERTCLLFWRGMGP